MDNIKSVPELTGRVSLQYRIEGGSWVAITPGVGSVIPETANYIRTEWEPAKDSKGEENVTYYLFLRQNEGPWVNVYSGRNTFYNQNIGPGNQGSNYDYFVRAKNKDGGVSEDITSIRFEKNIFTAAELKSPTKVVFNTPAIDVTYTGANNSNTSAVFTYFIKCNEIPIYNGETIDQTKSIAIWRDGEKPTTAYMHFEDIKERLKSTEYKGDIVLVLETTNKYETVKQTKFYVKTNLQIEPTAVTNQRIDLENSSSYVTMLGKSFIIPDKGRSNLISWDAGVGLLGEEISYEIYASYDGGETSSKIGETNSTTLTYSHTINKLTDVAKIRYAVRTKNSYGLFSDSETIDYTMHYIDAPVISVEDSLRTSAEFSFYAQIQTKTSIPKEELTIETVGSWSCVVKGEGTEVSLGTLEPTQYRQKIVATGLVDAGQYTVKITYTDNTGLFPSVTYDVPIGSNLPVVFINKFGLGVAGAKADMDNPLKVDGRIKAVDLDLENPLYVKDLFIDGEAAYHTGRRPTLLEIGALGSKGPQVLDLDGNSESEAFTIKGSIREIKIWTGNGGVALETPQGTPLYLGSGSHEDIAIKSDVIALAKGISFPAQAAWRSIDISRASGDLEGTARYGIGANGDSYSPTIEYHRFADSTTSLRSRLDLMSTSLRLSSHGADQTCWMGFYTGYATSVANRVGWVGYGMEDGSRDISISAADNFRVYTSNSNRLWTFKAIGNTNYGIVAGGTMIKTYGAVAEIQCRNSSDSAYGRFLGSAFVTIPTPAEETLDTTSYSELLSKIQVMKSKDSGKLNLSLQDSSPLGLSILSPDGAKGVDLYSISCLLWKIVQEQEQRIKELEKKLLKYT